MEHVDQKLRTAAYARVSRKSDLQDGSFEFQCAYFRQKILADPALTLVDIYGDHGKSGRSLQNRPGLQRLIQDCEKGQIDLVLCKSISRLGRSMQEVVETIRHFSRLGIGVHFEREGLHTDKMEGELILSILSAMAQEESDCLSQTMQASRQQHLKKGQPWENPRYGYLSQGPDHRWIINEGEAPLVRRAFRLACLGANYADIAADLTRLELKRGSQRVWQKIPVRNLLTSVVYKGDYLSHKEVRTITEDGRIKRIRNRGQAPQLYIRNHHQAIIRPELFDMVQSLIHQGLLHSRRSHYTPADLTLRQQARRLAERSFP